MNISPADSEHSALLNWIIDQRAQYKLYQERGEMVEDDEENGDDDDDDEEENEKDKNEDEKKEDKVEDPNDTRLTPDRISVLDAVGFHWNIKGDVFWQKQFESLVAYKKEFGDVKVPRLFAKNPKLGECEFVVACLLTNHRNCLFMLCHVHICHPVMLTHVKFNLITIHQFARGNRSTSPTQSTTRRPTLHDDRRTKTKAR